MTGNGQTASPGNRWRLAPIAEWIRAYDRRWLRGDLIAGGRGGCPDRPQEPGLCRDRRDSAPERPHAAAAGAILYAVFGTSRQISTGPSSDWRPWPRAPSRWPGSAGSRMRPPSSPGSRWCRACCTWFLVLAVFKMGWIAQFLSRAVVTGFLFGAAIDVVIGELSQAHRDRGQRLESAAGAVVLARDAGRCPAGDRRRTRRGACRIN
jgi:SulP family sulfate permease